MNRRVAVRGIIVHGDKLLCVQLKKYAGRPVNGHDNYWCTPGGGVNVGEPLVPALEREIVEELGVKPVVGNLLYMQQFAYNDIEQLEFFFHITNAEDFLHINLASTSHGQTEIAVVDFVDPAANIVLPDFLTKEPVAQHAATGIATKIFNNIA